VADVSSLVGVRARPRLRAVRFHPTRQSVITTRCVIKFARVNHGPCKSPGMIAVIPAASLRATTSFAERPPEGLAWEPLVVHAL